MMRSTALRGSSGFTLVEMIVVVFLLAIAMLGLLAVFDASARINKSEQQVADAQGSVRYGIYQMTRIIRMAGSGGLLMRQAVLTAAPAGLAGINPAGVSYDNVAAGTTVTDLVGTTHPVRTGTDMIEVRGVILSPLYDLLGNTCGGCTGSSSLNIPAQVNNAQLPAGIHYNDDPQRPQFAATVSYTSGVTGSNPMFVIVASGEDQSVGCSTPPNFPRYPQPIYNVALLSSAATVSSSTLTFPALNFGDSRAERYNGSDPAGAAQAPTSITNLSRGGVMDDVLYFIDDTDTSHPALAQAIRRGDSFDVASIADDVEDMQIAYGVFTDANPDLSESTSALGDNWTPNVQGESAVNPSTFIPVGATCPQLHAVMVSLLAKSRDPDPTYHGPTAAGFLMMNVPLSSGIPTTMATPGNYRRRVQKLRITLRNYSYESQ